ncbi:MAG: hypothetical protein NTY03_04915 [Candidatus Bathyarchaeota archaeon]|nr:hypothetical protein [Candidatus Bathyarchaeota archaeon]
MAKSLTLIKGGLRRARILFYIAVGLVAVGLVGAGGLSGSGHPLALAIEVTGNQTVRAIVRVNTIFLKNRDEMVIVNRLKEVLAHKS